MVSWRKFTPHSTFIRPFWPNMDNMDKPCSKRTLIFRKFAHLNQTNTAYEKTITCFSVIPFLEYLCR